MDVSQRSAIALAFALALSGGGALAAGWQSTSPTPASQATQQRPTPGHWTLSETGVLTWTTDATAPEVPAAWYEEHSRLLEQIQRDIDCQISACGQP